VDVAVLLEGGKGRSDGAVASIDELIKLRFFFWEKCLGPDDPSERERQRDRERDRT
jgi:hypothetical protein